jgi:quercetin dioxygenase-like cupin family protein
MVHRRGSPHVLHAHERPLAPRLEVEGADQTDAVMLEKPGDYVMWGPGVSHTYRAEEDSVVITVSWPSLIRAE